MIPMNKYVKLFGFDFISESDISVMAGKILNAESYEKDGLFPYLITPNVDDIVKFSKDENKELKDTFTKSIYVLPDGQLIVWASSLTKDKMAQRLPGSDLLPHLLDESKSNHKFLALTSSEKISDSLKEKNKNVVCYTLPFFDRMNAGVIDEVTTNCVKLIRENNIRIVIVGISFPKQNILAINIHKKLKAEGIEQMPLFCMLGASFEFYLKFKKRAPVLMQKLGLEWFHRFTTDPKRLFRRYFIEDMAFFPILFREVMKRGLPIRYKKR